MPNTITCDDGSGDVVTDVVSDFQAANPTAIIKTPSLNFSFYWNGVLTDYVLGQPAVVTADQFAAMTAAGCPIS